MIAFLDIETNHLDERVGDILEVALVITDDNLNEVAHESVVVRPQPREVPLEIDPVVQKMHEKNGLWADIERIGVERREAELRLCEFVSSVFVKIPDVETNKCVNCDRPRSQHGDRGEMNATSFHFHVVCPLDTEAFATGKNFAPKMVTALSETPLAGNSVGVFDCRWIRAQMPILYAMFNRHVIDASSDTQLCKRWSPDVYEHRPKNDDPSHRALEDCRSSIQYLQYYRSTGFVGGIPQPEEGSVILPPGDVYGIWRALFDGWSLEDCVSSEGIRDLEVRLRRALGKS